MENISKALLIAAGMLILIMILSLLVIGYQQISAYYSRQHDATMVEQTIEFNKRFENYNRNDIRGNELISLMNRVIDYNATQVYEEETKFKRLILSINVGEQDILDQFKYDASLEGKITSEIDNRSNDRDLIKITGVELNSKSIIGNNVTTTQLQRLSANIHYIMDDNNEEVRDEKIRSILTQIKKEDTYNINNIKNATAQYYEYTQFKRACFNCTGVEYDPDTGRVVRMTFKLQTKNDGKVVFK